MATCAATTVWAGFDTPMSCLGTMVFPNSDGSKEIYALDITLDAEGYVLQSTNKARNDTVVDQGACTAYLDSGCRHDVVVNGAATDMFYTFRLVEITATTYAYREVWQDGASAGTVLTCLPR